MCTNSRRGAGRGGTTRDAPLEQLGVEEGADAVHVDELGVLPRLAQPQAKGPGARHAQRRAKEPRRVLPQAQLVAKERGVCQRPCQARVRHLPMRKQDGDGTGASEAQARACGATHRADVTHLQRLQARHHVAVRLERLGRLARQLVQVAAQVEQRRLHAPVLHLRPRNKHAQEPRGRVRAGASAAPTGRQAYAGCQVMSSPGPALTCAASCRPWLSMAWQGCTLRSCSRQVAAWRRAWSHRPAPREKRSVSSLSPRGMLSVELSPRWPMNLHDIGTPRHGKAHALLTRPRACRKHRFPVRRKQAAHPAPGEISCFPKRGAGRAPCP